MAANRGGYDCQFVEPPPKSLECLICLLTLRDPHIISCCGNHFCQPCISRIQRDNQPCPLCKELNFTTFLHKGIMREVNSLIIYCQWRQPGCSWQGELGQLEEHLYPGEGPGCGYVKVNCKYRCGDLFERRHLQEHELEECPQRPVEVKMNSLARRLEAKLKATEEKLDAAIAENQAMKEVNHASKNKRQAIKAELLAIKDQNKLLTGRIATLESIVQKQEAIKQAMEQQQDEISHLRDQQKDQQKELATRFIPVPVLPFCFTVTNYEHYKSVDYMWISPPFYSHPGGYKMYCSMYLNGHDMVRGTHLSLYTGILRGEFDDKLKWPFNGVVTIEMYNRRTDTWGNAKIIQLDDTAPICYRQRPLNHLLGNSSRGNPKWLPLEDLKDYIRYDSVRFRISKIELK